MLNAENIGRPIMRIDGGKHDGKTISINSELDKKAKKAFNHVELDPNDKAKFTHVPNNKTNREVLYVAGPSGSGKSYYIKMYIKHLLKMYPKMDVYLISPFESDVSLDDIKPKRIKLKDDLVTDPIDPKELVNSCIIFDDIDSIKKKSIKEAICDLLDQCLEIGRHYNIFVLMTNHILCAGNSTKRILNEAHHITFFPHSGSKATMLRLCEEYGGIDKETLKKIKKTKSRWATIHRNYPIVISTEKKIFHPGDSDDDEDEN